MEWQKLSGEFRDGMMRVSGAMLRPVGGALFVAGLVFGSASEASAAGTCTTQSTTAPIYFGNNGGTTLAGATLIGTVGTGAGQYNQIGNLSWCNNTSGETAGAFVNGSANPSIYSFIWGGGSLMIQEGLGNNGAANGGVDAELALLSSTSLNANGSLTNALASLNFAATAGGAPTGYELLFNGVLAAGTYVIDTYLGNLAVDPDYQILFTPQVTTAVPEPITLSIFGAGFAGAAALRRRRKAKS